MQTPCSIRRFVYAGLVIFLTVIILLTNSPNSQLTLKIKGIIPKRTYQIRKDEVVQREIKQNVMTRFMSSMNTIPKRIHQIWNDGIIPAEFADNVRGLVRHNPHPEWEYYFWTKESGLKFLADKYPGLYRRIMAGADDVMRADIIRIAAIYEYGGVYFDLDTVSVKPLDEYVTTHECSLALEPAEHCIGGGNDYLITNSALLCRNRHSFFKLLLSHIPKVPTSCKNAFTCTGPDMFTAKYKSVLRAHKDEMNSPNSALTSLTSLPDLERSEVFQDVYDVKGQSVYVYRTCIKDDSKLTPTEIRTCNNWRARGKDKRALSPMSLTFHSWFHVYGKNVTRLPENNISYLVPHAKIYGVHFGIH